jgi:hypothetical protein
MKRSSFVVLTAVVSLGMAAMATAHAHAHDHDHDHDHHLHGGDFTLHVHEHDGKLEIEISPRVLGGELDPTLGFAATDPGFDSHAGTFPVGSGVGINLTEPLMKWNGDGFDPLDPLAEETMTVAFLTLSATTSDGFVPGFAINVDGDGSFHKHLAFILNGVGSDDPRDGIYLLTFELYSTNSTIHNSDPAWIVFNLNMDDHAHHEPAIDWVKAHLVPEPTTAMLLVAAGAMALRRRR